MVEALKLKKTDKVLEVGSGSGYGAAIMSKLVKKVYTTEIIPSLVKFAKTNLKKAKIKNVEIIGCDGGKGYEKNEPYDKIIITAGCPAIPPILIDQLKEGGIIIAPVGSAFGQKMIKGTKKNKKLKKESLGDFMFVPLRGKYGHLD
jgi:protein-L-isoaspartate(D-aspartate) O-methyltransferase